MLSCALNSSFRGAALQASIWLIVTSDRRQRPYIDQWDQDLSWHLLTAYPDCFSKEGANLHQCFDRTWGVSLADWRKHYAP